MLIQLKKEVTETVEVKTPFYCKSNISYHMITEGGILISVMTNQITVWEKATMFTSSNIQRVLKESIECSCEEFETAFSETAGQIGLAIDKLISFRALPQPEKV